MNQSQTSALQRHFIGYNLSYYTQNTEPYYMVLIQKLVEAGPVVGMFFGGHFLKKEGFACLHPLLEMSFQHISNKIIFFKTQGTFFSFSFFFFAYSNQRWWMSRSL